MRGGGGGAKCEDHISFSIYVAQRLQLPQASAGDRRKLLFNPPLLPGGSWPWPNSAVKKEKKNG